MMIIVHKSPKPMRSKPFLKNIANSSLYKSLHRMLAAEVVLMSDFIYCILNQSIRIFMKI